MKHLALLACFFAFTLPQQTASAETAAPGGPPQDTPVKLGITTDLVKDFPIAVTATTSGDELRLTFGPKADGQYCTLDARILRLKDGGAKVIATFVEETKVVQADGVCTFRNVGFSDLSTILARGEEEILFSLGEKKFTIKLLKIKD
jgi:hypothetical protein